MADLADIFINDDHLAFIGVQVHFAQPGRGTAFPVQVVGSLSFLGDIAIHRPTPPLPTPPIPPSEGGVRYAGSAALPVVGGRSATFALGPLGTASLAGDLSVTTTPALTKLKSMRKMRDAYPLYDAIDALIQVVLELSSHTGSI